MFGLGGICFHFQGFAFRVVVGKSVYFNYFEGVSLLF
jgi:hypothetical protein